jgi:hypothetical protein
MLAGTPWLDVFCPGSGTSRAIDIRTIDRHPLASVGTLVLGLRCSWVSGVGAECRNWSGCSALPPARRAHGGPTSPDVKVLPGARHRNLEALS